MPPYIPRPLQFPITKQYTDRIISFEDIGLFEKILENHVWEINAQEVIDIIEQDREKLFEALVRHRYDFTTNNYCVVFYCLIEEKFIYLKDILRLTPGIIEVIKKEKEKYTISDSCIIEVEKMLLEILCTDCSGVAKKIYKL